MVVVPRLLAAVLKVDATLAYVDHLEQTRRYAADEPDDEGSRA